MWHKLNAPIQSVFENGLRVFNHPLFLKFRQLSSQKSCYPFMQHITIIGFFGLHNPAHHTIHLAQFYCLPALINIMHAKADLCPNCIYVCFCDCPATNMTCLPLPASTSSQSYPLLARPAGVMATSSVPLQCIHVLMKLWPSRADDF